MPKQEDHKLASPIEPAAEEAVSSPIDYRCPVSLWLFFDPRLASDGNTYEADMLARLTHSPSAGEALDLAIKTPNRAMKRLVSDFLRANPAQITELYCPMAQFLTAIQTQNLDQVKRLLAQELVYTNRGFFLTQITEAGELSAFQVACTQGSLPIVQHLIEHAQRTQTLTQLYQETRPGDYQPTYLHQNLLKAAKNGDNETLGICLRLGADIHAEDTASQTYSSTALHWAARSNHASTIEYLLDQGAEIDRAVRDHSTALHYSVSLGSRENTQALQMLLRHGANINAQDDSGNTPLHDAGGYNNPVAGSALLRHGANLFIRNQKGLFPMAHIRAKGSQATAHTLEDVEAELTTTRHHQIQDQARRITALEAQVRQLTQLVKRLHPRTQSSAEITQNLGLFAQARRMRRLEPAEASSSEAPSSSPATDTRPSQ